MKTFHVEWEVGHHLSSLPVLKFIVIYWFLGKLDEFVLDTKPEGEKGREIEWSGPHQLSSPFWPCSVGKGPRLAHRGDSPHFLWGFGKKRAANAASRCSQSCCERPGKESRGRGRSIINHRSQPTPEMVGAPNPGSSTIDWIKFLNEPAAVGRHVAERTDWGHPVCCPATGNLTL